MSSFAAVVTAVIASFPALTHCYKATHGEHVQASVVVDASGEISTQAPTCFAIVHDNTIDYVFREPAMCRDKKCHALEKDVPWTTTKNGEEVELTWDGSKFHCEAKYIQKKSKGGNSVGSERVCCKRSSGDGVITYEDGTEKTLCTEANGGEPVTLEDGQRCRKNSIEGEERAEGSSGGCCVVSREGVRVMLVETGITGCGAKLFSGLMIDSARWQAEYQSTPCQEEDESIVKVKGTTEASGTCCSGSCAFVGAVSQFTCNLLWHEARSKEPEECVDPVVWTPGAAGECE
jgi:hypothetical protein